MTMCRGKIEQAKAPDDALSAIAHQYVVVDGYFIPPHMIQTRTPGRVVCTNGKTITYQEAGTK